MPGQNFLLIRGREAELVKLIYKVNLLLFSYNQIFIIELIEGTLEITSA